MKKNGTEVNINKADKKVPQPVSMTEVGPSLSTYTTFFVSFPISSAAIKTSHDTTGSFLHEKES